MRKLQLAFGWLFVLLGSIGCEPQSQEFALPEGNIDNGQALFVSFSCTSCHTVRNLELPVPEAKGPVSISLGGGVGKMKSYSELVTSVINPSHRLVRYRRADEISQTGESLMSIYNDTMTVTELVDIVAFLDSRYEKIERPKIRYTEYDN